MLIPYATDRKLSRRPVVTYGLIAVNVLTALVLYLGWREHYRDILVQGALVPGHMKDWTLLTSMFLHVSIWHLLANLVYLWIFGRHIEDVLGSLTFAFTYASGGLAAALTHCLMAYTIVPAAASAPAVGASGAVAALMGIFAVRFASCRVKCFLWLWRPQLVEVRAALILVVWLAGEVAGGLLSARTHGPTPAHWAHVGGFLCGALVAVIMNFGSDARDERLREQAISYVALGRWDQAVDHFRQLITRHPEDARSRANLAALYLQAGDQRRAAEQFEHAVAVHLRTDQPYDALRLLDTLQQELPTYRLSPAVALNVSRVEELAGRTDEALHTLLAIVHTSPRPAEFGEALLRAAELTSHRAETAPMALTLCDQFAERFPRSPYSLRLAEIRQLALRRCGVAGPLSILEWSLVAARQPFLPVGWLSRLGRLRF